MKKLIFVLTLLLLVSPALAKVNVYCTADGNEVSVYYDMGSDPNRPVAFGLDISVDSGGNIEVPTNVDPNFWVYPGTIDINTEADPPEVNEYGTVYADPCDHPDTNGGPGTGAMTIEMGALFSPPEVNSVNAPPSSGLLLKFKVDVDDCNVNIVENGIRGGVVLVGGEASDPNLTGCAVVGKCYAGMADYDQWQAVGEPECWCYINQCYGDADGKQEGKPPNVFYVGTADLTILKSAWLNTTAQVYGTTKACADFNHLEEGKPPNVVRVGTADLTILKNNWLSNPPGDCQPGNCEPGQPCP